MIVDTAAVPCALQGGWQKLPERVAGCCKGLRVYREAQTHAGQFRVGTLSRALRGDPLQDTETGTLTRALRRGPSPGHRGDPHQDTEGGASPGH